MIAIARFASPRLVLPKTIIYAKLASRAGVRNKSATVSRDQATLELNTNDGIIQHKFDDEIFAKQHSRPTHTNSHQT